MNDARGRAEQDMERHHLGQVLEHVETTIKYRGVLVWERDCVVLAVPHDPVEGDHEHTMFVLYAGGAVQRIADVVERTRANGITHWVYNWGFKRGQEKMVKLSVSRWLKLVRKGGRDGQRLV